MKESMMPSEDGMEKVTGCARINPGRAAVAFIPLTHSCRVQPYIKSRTSIRGREGTPSILNRG